MPYEVPPLPYEYNALEPHIDEATMRVHHDKHHQAYVDKANGALEGTEWDGKPIEDVLRDLSSLPADKRTVVRNNGGGHYNHSLFWEQLGAGKGGEPSGPLAEAINSAFGSFDDFKTKFKDAGVNQFGSGWSWLVHDGSGLAVVSSANQDNPVSGGKTPLLGVDVWEHAYYLKYQNRRPDYIDAFGSFDDFKTKFKEAGVNQFGSGWAWLVHDGSGLQVVSSPNQDNPVSEGLTPLLGCDVWEHAYYLKYQNRRPDYIDAFWNVVDWDKVGERFSAAG